MDNIYVQSEAERNSIVEIPEGLAEQSGDRLYSWLGSIWRSLHAGDDMVRGLQRARGIRLAQMAVDALEAARLNDRNRAPVMHRELWHPIRIRRSERDTSQENMLDIGGDVRKMGPQPEGSEYGAGTVFLMGRMARYASHVTYPISGDICGGAKIIVDNMISPRVIMERDKGDFDVRNGAIVFPSEYDPLTADLGFDLRDVPPDDPDHPEDHDVEAVLWASDVLFDRGYVADHVSYPLGARAPSSDLAKRIVNAAWSALSSGLTPELARTLMAAMLNIPVIQGEKETVLDIRPLEDGARAVVTDGGTYMVSPRATLRKAVKEGAVLRRGDLLDESVRIYPFLGEMCSEPSPVASEYSVPVELDVPSVVVPESMIRARTEHGIFAMWGEETVRKVRSGGVDRLMFDVGGDESDVSAFWNDVWRASDESGTPLESIIGEEGTRISPARFFLRNLVGANSIYVVVDRTQVDDVSMMRNPMFFDMLMEVVPSSVRLFLVERRSAGEDDVVDVGGSEESESVSAALPRAVDGFSHESVPGSMPGSPSFGESVSIRFVRPAPRRVRGRKEEEP